MDYLTGNSYNYEPSVKLGVEEEFLLPAVHHVGTHRSRRLRKARPWSGAFYRAHTNTSMLGILLHILSAFNLSTHYIQARTSRKTAILRSHDNQISLFTLKDRTQRNSNVFSKAWKDIGCCPRWSRGNVLASRSNVREFKSGWGRWIFSGRKSPEHKSSERDFKLGIPSLRFQAR